MPVQRQIDRLLAQRAAEWIETLKGGNAEDHAAFVAWLRQSKLHAQQYLEMVAIDQELQRLSPAQGEDIDTLLKRIAPGVIELESMRIGLAQPTAIRKPRRELWRVGAGLAAAIVLCLVAFQWHSSARNRISTAVGEQRTVSLSDGSVITLNALSTVKIDFSPAMRNIDLEHGEAVFKVAHDAVRPFVVRTRTANVRAIGTQFNVYQRPQGTLVSVLEGRVQVIAHGSRTSGAPNDARSMQNLAAGEEAQVAATGRIEKNAHPDVNKTTAWRERRLFFEETPLEEMVREFNRYGRSVQIKIEGIEPGSRRYGGIFDADDPNSLAELLAREPDLIVETRGEEIVIRKR